MRMTVFATAALGSAVALLGFASLASASATIDLIWAETGTNVITTAILPPAATINVMLTAGAGGSRAAAVSVDYSSLVNQFAVIGFASTPGGPLPVLLGPTINTGTRIENINSGAAPTLGIGLAPGQSHQIGTVTFYSSARVGSSLTILSDTNGPSDGVLDLAGNDITSTTTFNSAFVFRLGDQNGCDASGAPMQIEVNALRAGGKTVRVGANQTTDVTAKARILKGSAPSDTTIVTTLAIEAVDGTGVVDMGESPPVTLVVGKGGTSETLSLNTTRCVGGFITFLATFSGPDADGDLCSGTRTLRKECR